MSQYTPQEQRILSGLSDDDLSVAQSMKDRPRIQRILKSFRLKKPRMAIERALLFTESYRTTGGQPVILRWGKAVRHVLENISIAIMPDELIVGRGGPEGRYGILYPEIRCSWLRQTLEAYDAGKPIQYTLQPEEAEALRNIILPYWEGRTMADAQAALLPEESKHVFYADSYYSPKFIINETATERHILQWVPDFEKVLTRGTSWIAAEAQRKLDELDPVVEGRGFEKRAFLLSVLEVCSGMERFALRYAELARSMAESCDDEARKAELLQIAANCERVPMKPARNFWEAIQSQWFTQLAIRFEVFASGGLSQGRIDQYFYPFYRKDKDEGRIDDARALELLESLWFKIAESMTMRPAFNAPHRQGNSHYEAATVGGLLEDGRDGTNELSYLILQSKRDFPLDYPDLACRIHTLSPEPFLAAVCEVIKQGTGFPKLFNDEFLIPYYMARGATRFQARRYAVSGCTEVRIPNVDTYLTGNCNLNAALVVEMTLLRGKQRLRLEDMYGIDTGDPTEFKTFEEFWDAFARQFSHLIRHVFLQNQIFDSLKPQYMASPVISMLHDKCFEQCQDIHSGKIEGTVNIGFWEPTGYGTVIDSLCAIKKLVYDEKRFSMAELLAALEDNFENYPVIRQYCLAAPKFGNDDPYADEMGLRLESFYRSLSEKFKTLSGGRLEVRYVPVTAHIAAGRVVGALPNGRLACEPLSEGVGPQQGCDVNGPTALLKSVANTSYCDSDLGAARLFNMKLSPSTVNGEKGTANLCNLIRTWCDLKLWHIQFNVVNNSTLKAAQKEPQKFRNLIVRVAGYSAYFVDLSKDLQEEIVRRTEHSV